MTPVGGKGKGPTRPSPEETVTNLATRTRRGRLCDFVRVLGHHHRVLDVLELVCWGRAVLTVTGD